jgi:putative ubiquitin-RnfH superfamily antitoxin RatB of RatAB toxin-antitoxin module
MALADPPAATLSVTVVYCPSALAVDEVALTLEEGSTLADAVERSGLLQRYPELQEAPGDASARRGVWGHVRPDSHLLRDGDRVECYRPLEVEPMEARRLRHKPPRSTTGSRTR